MSAKLRLTAWFTLMMLLLCAATLTFVFVVNGAAVADDPQSQLIGYSNFCVGWAVKK